MRTDRVVVRARPACYDVSRKSKGELFFAEKAPHPRRGGRGIQRETVRRYST